jgi:hypothetical protein
MTGSEMRKEAADYLTMQLEERKNAGITKVPKFDERDVLQAYSDGLLSGLRHHSYDYLVKTADLKQRYKKQKEIIRDFLSFAIDYIDKEDKNYSFIVEAEQFLKDLEEEPCGQ